MAKFTVIEKETQTVVATNTWVVEAKDEKEALKTYIENGNCTKQKLETVAAEDSRIEDVRPFRAEDRDNDLYMVLAAIEGNENLEVIDFNLTYKEALSTAFETEKLEYCDHCKIVNHLAF